MTELETLQRAKMYMEKLANGINPLDGSIIEDHEVVNQVRLSRCFFYVADVLGQVINNGGVKPQKPIKKEPFALPLERRGMFEFSDTPIPVSELAKRINKLAEDNMMNLPYTAIRNWLVYLEMLEEVPDGNGKSVKRPTPRGETMGITLESRTGRNGPYFVTLYHLAAQHFIMDNLDAIIEFDRAKKAQKYSPAEKE